MTQPTTAPAPARSDLEDLGREIHDAWLRAFAEWKPLWPRFGELLAPIIERERASAIAAAEAARVPASALTTAAAADEIWEAWWQASRCGGATTRQRFIHLVGLILDRYREAAIAAIAVAPGFGRSNGVADV